MTRRSTCRRASRSRTPSGASTSSPRPGRYDGGFLRFSDALKRARSTWPARAYQRDGHLSGLATGLDDLDALMGGLQASDLIILAGRPGMGKTALATNIAFNVAKPTITAETQPDGSIETVDGGIVGFFSLEMSAEQLATRVLAEQSEIPSSSIRRGDITDADFGKLAGAAQVMQRCRSTSTTPAASRSPSSPRAPGA